MIRKRSLLVALALGLTVAACAPRTARVTAPAGPPRHPEFVFPGAEGTTPQRILDEHQLAWQFLQGGDARNAERRYQAVLKRSADFYPAHAGLGYAALVRKAFDDALGHFDRALAANPSYAPALAGKGQTFLAMGRREQALASFDAALASDPNLPSIRSAADVLRVQTLQGSVSGARRAAKEGRLAEARTAYQQAIQASPQSPFLHRELAEVERRDGNLPAALEHARRAVQLEPEARNHLVAATILEEMGDYQRALEALEKAAALEPSATLTERIDTLRARVALDAMPEEYRAIGEAATVTRAQLAALIGVRLEDVVARAPRTITPVITDIRSNWAQPWILAVTRAGMMEVYPNHTFQPNTVVRRGDLAFAASRILSVIAASNPALSAKWRNARRRFPDLPQGHLRHPAAALAVEAGVMNTLDGGGFGLSRPVSGAEAIAAIDRLRELADASTPR